MFDFLQEGSLHGINQHFLMIIFLLNKLDLNIEGNCHMFTKAL